MSALAAMLLVAAGSTNVGTVALSSVTASGGSFSAPATASYSLLNTGFITGSGLVSGKWIDPQEGMSLFEVRATFLSGQGLSQGSTGVWQALSVTRTWAIDNNDSGTTVSTQLLLEIRMIGTTGILASATITIESSLNVI